jgi:hypothetical protein
VIIACHHEQNIFKMGGLRKKLPLVYACLSGGWLGAGGTAAGDCRLLQQGRDPVGCAGIGA